MPRTPFIRPQYDEVGQTCAVPGCERPTQAAVGEGFSKAHCTSHVKFERRHGSYWRKSLTAAELAPFRKAAKGWIRANRDDLRVRRALDAISAHLADAGRSVNAYSLRGLSAEERARIAVARLRDDEATPEQLLETAIAVTECVASLGFDDRMAEYRIVQIAKVIHRLASGTHKTTSGFPLKSKYPPSEGRVLRILGKPFDAFASFALDGRSTTTPDET